jgi:DNA polymerase I-like protein with 3'-5' exonuclease and polymerase domains
MGTCDTCTLKNIYSPLTYAGEGRLKLLVIGSSPSMSEQADGQYGSSKEFLLFRKIFAENGKDILHDCWYTTVFGCHLKEKTSPAALSACEKRLSWVIKKLNPSAILLLGDVPYQALLRKSIAKGRMKGLSYLDLVGDTIPDRTLNRWICPVWGIQDLLYEKVYDDGAKSKPLWERDNAAHILMASYLYNFYACADKPLPKLDLPVKTTLDKEQAITWLSEALTWKYCAFDYETDCRKPYKDGKIYYASISNGQIAYAFPFFGSARFRGAWKKLLTSDVGKIAHNNQFENTWTRKCLGYWVDNWEWDTCIGMHCVNNKKPTNLKYCVYADFGVAGYDSSADPYITSSEADNKEFGSYAKNRINELDPEDAMKYNALDSLFTARLYELQKSRLSQFQLDGMRLLLDTEKTLARMSFNGIRVHEGNFDSVDKELHAQVEEIYKAMLSDPILSKWDKPTPINLGSSKQLSHLLFDLCGKKPLAYTAKRAPSTDKETLKKYNMPLLNNLLAYRESKKMADTYVKGWQKECVNGYVHPDFSLNTVETYRSSAQNPNPQNNYKRDKKKKKVVRSLIRPRDGHRLIEYDYKSLEVMINGDHSRDPSLIKYCTDPSTDMHRDGACDVLMLKPEELKGEWRSALKGLFTFAEFYGSYYVLVAKGIWEWLQGVPELLTHLDKCGIHNYDAFEAHMQKCEEKLWTVRFGVHDQWRKKQFQDYQNKGYLESFTGFRLQGLMSRNNSFNGAVQGDGFHTLCWYMNKLQAKFDELGLNSCIINEIHDSLVIDVDPAEEAIVDYWVYQFGVVEVAKAWKWLVIPLQIEKERSAVDGTWAEMEECGYLTGEKDKVICKGVA